MVNEVLANLVSGFNLDPQYHIKFWGDRRSDLMYPGMDYV